MASPVRPRPWLWIAIVAPILAFVSLASWALSSPVGASPDDDFHLASIWCGLGERAGVCEDPGDPVERLVPAAVAGAPCYAHRADESGACWNPGAEGMVRVDRANADGLYPRVYYAVMSSLVGPDVAWSVMAMRLLNCAIAVGLLTATFWALPRRVRPALIVSITATSVPLGLFIVSSNNPSSWAVLSGMVVWITLYGATQTTGRRRVALASLYVLGCVMGAGARADAGAYAVFGTALALILGARRLRSQMIPIAAASVGVAVSIGLYLTAWQGDSLATGMVQGNAPLSPGQLLSNAQEIPTLWLGALGSWGLGWLDTPLPGIVFVLASSAFFGAFYIGLRGVDRRRAIAIVLAVLALWAVPFVLLYQSNALVGDLVQPRYVLPLMIIALGVASLRSDAAQAWSRARLWVAGVALTLAFGTALHTNIRRYTTGLDEFHVDPGSGAEWWWAGAPSPLVNLVLGTAAFAATFVMWGLVLRHDASSASPGPHSQDSERGLEGGLAPGGQAPNYARASTDVARARPVQ